MNQSIGPLLNLILSRTLYGTGSLLSSIYLGCTFSIQELKKETYLNLLNDAILKGNNIGDFFTFNLSLYFSFINLYTVMGFVPI